MTDKNIELTRRQILGSAGAIGLAGAGAGLGTSAFFSDEETFEGNTVAAGELDLVVDWEEHYSYPQLYGFDDPTDGLDHDLLRSDPENAEYVGFPDPENPMVWLHRDDVDTYMASTAIEAFPDHGDDGQQEMEEGDFEYQPCEDGANLPEHLDPSGLRTDNGDTQGGEEDDWAPLVNLDDVKPGDFGELTLSFHLCDNPGYVWLQAANVSEDENGITEPESEVDDTEEEAELAQNIQTAWWYDTNGNNVIDQSIGAVDVMLAVDTSTSLDEQGDGDVGDLEAAANDLASDLVEQADARVGGLTFADNVDDFTSLADGPVDFTDLEADGGTAMPAALDIAAQELDANGRSDAETFIVLFTDGGPNYTNGRDYELGGYEARSFDDGNTQWETVTDGELDETATVADDARADHRILAVGINDDRAPEGRTEGDAGLLSAYLRDEIAGDSADYFSADQPADLNALLQAILQSIAVAENVFHQGTLDEDLESLSSGDGIPLDAGFEEGVGEGPFDTIDDPRECFQPGSDYYIGFAWWLPTDVGNEIQSDSVAFDLGFYAEQCRNNGGEGDTPTPAQ